MNTTYISTLAAVAIGAAASLSIDATASTSTAPEMLGRAAPSAAATQAGFNVGMQCVRDGATIGLCGRGNLLRACDARWHEACKYFRGTATACDAACEDKIICQDKSDLYQACNKAFKDACRDHGHEYHCCQSSESNCISGVCGGGCHEG